jgi:hypothetical protein
MPILSPRIAPLRKALDDPNTPGTVLLIILIDHWGAEFFEWEPETLKLQAQADFGAEIPQENRDKIWALVTYLTTDKFFATLDAFIHICNALSDDGADFLNFDPAGVQEICWALTETQLLEPYDGETFNPEIPIYMTARLREEGFVQAPKIMAPYVLELPSEESVGAVVSADGIEEKSFFDKQTAKRLSVETANMQRLKQMATMLAQLPLRNASKETLSQMKARVDKAAEGQATTVRKEVGSLPPRPSL